MAWKIINISNPGTSVQFGGDDTDKINKGFSGVDVDDYDINSDFKFRDGKLQIANPANDFKYTINSSAISADRILNLPLTTATDTLASLGLAQTFTATKTFTASTTLDNYIDSKIISAPASPSSGYNRLYSKQVDSNNDGLFAKQKVNGAVVEVRYA